MPAIPNINTLVRRQEPEPMISTRDKVLAGTGLAGGGKAVYDIRNISRKLDNWEQAIEGLKATSAPLMNNRGASMSVLDAGKALDIYSRQGADLIRSKFLGIPLPWMMARYGNPAVIGDYKEMAKGIIKDRNIPFRLGDRGFAGEYLGKAINTTFPDKKSLTRKAIDALLNPNAPNAAAPYARLQGLQSHYDIFKNKPVSDVSKHVFNKSILDTADNFGLGPAAMDIIHSTEGAIKGGPQTLLPGNLTGAVRNEVPSLAGMPFSEYLRKLIMAHPDKAAGKAAVLGALRNTVNAYVTGHDAHMGKYLTMARKAGIPGVAVATALGTGAMMAPAIRDTFTRQKRSADEAIDATQSPSMMGRVRSMWNYLQDRKIRKRNEQIAGGTSLAAGLGVGAHGARTMARPLDVAVTWGENPAVGEGHKSPGESLEAALKSLQDKDPKIIPKNVADKVPEFRLTRAIRSAKGPVDSFQPSRFGGVVTPRNVIRRTFDTMFDTGAGASLPGFIMEDTAKRSLPELMWHEYSRPKSRLGGHVHYMTDLPAPGSLVGNDIAGIGRYSRGSGIAEMVRGAVAPKLFRDTTIFYGPKRLVQPMPNLISHRASEFVSPLIRPENITALKSAPGKSAIAEMLLSAPGVELSHQTADVLKSTVSGTPTIVISGAGRGDVVAHQVHGVAQELKSKGLLGKVNIIALLGGSDARTPLARTIQDIPGVAAVGKVTAKGLFPILPMLGDYHHIAGGSSTGFESLAAPRPFSLIPNFTKVREAEIESIKDMATTVAGRQQIDDTIRKSMEANPSKWHGLSHASSFAEKFKQLIANQREIDLDAWNIGMKPFYLGKNRTGGGLQRGGVYAAQTAGDIVSNLFKAMKPEQVASSAARAKAYQGYLAAARTKLVQEILPAILTRQNKLKNIRGGAGLLGGLGMAGLGGYLLNKNRNKGILNA